MRREEKIIKGMKIKGLILLLIFLVVSLCWGDIKVFLGVFVGSVVAYLDFILMTYVMEDLIKSNSRFIFFSFQAIKYLVIAVVFAVLFVKKLVNPVACVVGLSLLCLIPFTEISSLKNA